MAPWQSVEGEGGGETKGEIWGGGRRWGGSSGGEGGGGADQGGEDALHQVSQWERWEINCWKRKDRCIQKSINALDQNSKSSNLEKIKVKLSSNNRFFIYLMQKEIVHPKWWVFYMQLKFIKNERLFRTEKALSDSKMILEWWKIWFPLREKYSFLSEQPTKAKAQRRCSRFKGKSKHCFVWA